MQKSNTKFSTICGGVVLV